MLESNRFRKIRILECVVNGDGEIESKRYIHVSAYTGSTGTGFVDIYGDTTLTNLSVTQTLIIITQKFNWQHGWNKEPSWRQELTPDEENDDTNAVLSYMCGYQGTLYLILGIVKIARAWSVLF